MPYTIKESVCPWFKDRRWMDQVKFTEEARQATFDYINNNHNTDGIYRKNGEFQNRLQTVKTYAEWIALTDTYGEYFCNKIDGIAKDLDSKAERIEELRRMGAKEEHDAIKAEYINDYQQAEKTQEDFSLLRTLDNEVIYPILKDSIVKHISKDELKAMGYKDPRKSSSTCAIL